MTKTTKTKFKLGWKKELPDHRDYKFEKVLKLTGAPTPNPPPKADLSKYIKRVKDQGNLGSCTAHGTTSAFEALQVKKTGKDVAGSRLYEYRNARIIDKCFPGDNGATIRGAVKASAKYGIPPETDWPYKISKFDKKPPVQAVTDALKDESTSYYLVDSAHGHAQTLVNLKLALGVTDLPVVYGTPVYDQIQYVNSNGIIDMPKPDEADIGGHCMMFFGYDDTRACLKTLNSWGTKWGMPFGTVQMFTGGAGWLPYGYVTEGLVSDCRVIAQESMLTAAVD